MAAVTSQPIKREGSQPTQYQRGQARKVQQVRLVSRLSEVSSGRDHRLELDGAEAIRQVYGEDGEKQHNCHRDTGERDKCSDNHSQSSEQLDKNCRPRQPAAGSVTGRSWPKAPRPQAGGFATSSDE